MIKMKKFIAVLLVVAMILPNIVSANEISISKTAPEVIRIGGANRYETSALIAKEVSDSFEKVIIASGENYPDALAGSILTQGKYPILLVSKSSIDDEVSTIIDGKEEAVILGGLNTVGQEVEDLLKEKVANVKRLHGDDRFATSVEIAKEIESKSHIFASGENFPDALSGGALSLLNNSPILLTSKNNISDGVKTFIEENETETATVLGGENTISAEAENEVKNLIESCSRIYGDNRYSTSIKIAEEFNGPETIILASGDNYPDALAAAALSKKNNAPIILVGNTIIKEVEDYIKNNDISKVYIVGGENSVSNEIFNILNEKPSNDESQNNNQAGHTSNDNKKGDIHVHYIMGLDDKAIENINEFKNVFAVKGDAIKRPKDPISKLATFKGWYTAFDSDEEFDFTKPISSETNIFAKWDIISTDTDGDGLYDPLEEMIGTDPNKADTDGDGLNDKIELIIGTDPLKVDTDGNGVSDYDEDADDDTLTNGYEVEVGTDPSNKDTDRDGIDDYEEIEEYKTNPLNPDTDGDGAEDLWEIENGYDPRLYDESFMIKVETEEVTEVNLVSATVETKIKGNQIGNFEIKRVSTVENPIVRETLPGYLGSAYKVTLDGETKGSTITFNYNTEFYGAPTEEFQPRIYRLDEESQLYEELEEQVVNNGIVQAKLEEAAIYILLNSVEFNRVWETQIKPPDYELESSDASIDIAFVIDYSNSMTWNDSDELYKMVTKSFISKLRDGKDRGALIKFIRKAYLLSNLTTDKVALVDIIDKIKYDNGRTTYSGTDGSTGIKMALDQLKNQDTKYKYIIFMTDGEDNKHTYSYDKLIEQAKNENIIIYTIGLGQAKEDVLTKIANLTNGKYYHATATAEDEDPLGLGKVFDEIESETIDYTTDSNNDGISDYYTKLIYEGKMPMAEQFAGIDFNESADLDGDGLKNGEELKITVKDKKVYVKMVSNPLMKHSDNDAIDDYEEVKQKSDPLKYTLNRDSLNYLLEDGHHMYSTVSKLSKEHMGFGAALEINRFIHGVYNVGELYRDLMIKYFEEFETIENFENQKNEEQMEIIRETNYEILKEVNKYAFKYPNLIKDIHELNSDIMGSVKSNPEIMAKYKEILNKVAKVIPDIKFKIRVFNNESKVLDIMKNEKFLNYAEKYSVGTYKFLKHGFTVLVGISDMKDTIDKFSTINANHEVFIQNLDILEQLYYYSEDYHTRNAAREIGQNITDNYIASFKNVFKAIIDDFAENAGPELITAAIKLVDLFKLPIAENAWFIAVKDWYLPYGVVQTSYDLFFGLKEKYTAHYEMYNYNEMSMAAKRLLMQKVVDRTNHYEALEKGISNELDIRRYLIHLAQLRILGGEKYYERSKNRGVYGYFIKDEELFNDVENTRNRIHSASQKLFIDKVLNFKPLELIN